MFRTVFLSVSLFACLCVKAQDEDRNIVIQSAKEEYSFVKGDKANPVKVEEEISVSYLCNDYRTTIPVAEFYNNQIELNGVEVKINGSRQKGFKPTYDFYNDAGTFYSDAKVCYFSLPLEKKGSNSDVVFKKTVLDPRYFTSIYFTEPYELEQKEVTIAIPKWMKVELKEYNFKGYSISKKVETKNDVDVYTYTIQGAAAQKREKNAPGPTYLVPHLLILSKWAEPNGSRITYFNTLDDQYAWYHQLVNEIGNDATTVKAKAEEITNGLTGDMEKVKAIYQWVQDNIRYIAFEDGIAGFKPEKAQEVLRKKFGDCKGMGNLMAEMLKSIGLDGRKCWLGTNHIAYDYSTPSLSVDNHMICAWIYKGKTYFLDATEKFIGLGENAERIQGRQVLIEDGNHYLLETIPISDPLQNTSYEKRTLTVNGNDLVGKVVQVWKGENKEWLLTSLHDIKRDKQEEALTRYLSDGNTNYQVSNLKIINLNDYNADLRVEYDLLYKNAITSFGNESYLDIDNRKDFGQFRFDTAKRKLPYQFVFKDHMIFETELELPTGSSVTSTPSALKVVRPGYSMSGTWSVSGKKITYRREIKLNNVNLPTDHFKTWNEDIAQLDGFYNNQLVVTK